MRSLLFNLFFLSGFIPTVTSLPSDLFMIPEASSAGGNSVAKSLLVLSRLFQVVGVIGWLRLLTAQTKRSFPMTACMLIAVPFSLILRITALAAPEMLSWEEIVAEPAGSFILFWPGMVAVAFVIYHSGHTKNSPFLPGDESVTAGNFENDN